MNDDGSMAFAFGNDNQIAPPEPYMERRPPGLYEKIQTLKKYLLIKVEQGDWHAVSDCANDIRVLEGK